MVTFILMLKRKQGMTTAQFREHYETFHVALAKKYLGHLFVDYQRHYPELTLGFEADGKPFPIGDQQYDVITKVDFKDRADFEEFQRLCASPEIRKELAADGDKFVDRTRCHHSVTERVRTWTGADLVGNR
jgi:hypothetical protein